MLKTHNYENECYLQLTVRAGGVAQTLNAGHGGSKILQIFKILSLHDSSL